MENTIRTQVDFIARNTKVLVRADFKISILRILDDEEVKKSTPEKYTVVAIGDAVKDLQLGDHVALSAHSLPQLMDFKWNNQSLKVKQDLQKNNKAIIGNPNITFSEYFIVDNIDIIGVYPNKADA